MNNKVIITIIVIAFAVGGYYWFSSGDNQSGAKPIEEKSGAEVKKDSIVRGFTEKYKPNTNISSSTVYSFQLEAELVKTGKPIIFSASLDDIFRKDDKLFIRFWPSFLDFVEPQISYTLEGCAEKIDQLTSPKDDLFGEYVVVAKITSVRKPIVKIDASASDEDAELELSQTQTFLTTGTCLDLEYVEDNGFNN